MVLNHGVCFPDARMDPTTDEVLQLLPASGIRVVRCVQLPARTMTRTYSVFRVVAVVVGDIINQYG